ncbi:MAG: FUR family transcriptional regulator [Pseudomonadota bacterium]
MAERAEGRNHAERVLGHLRIQNKPLSAYELLERLRAEGITAATTVYRALDKLLADGRVHRIESLNAWMACCDPSHAETPVFEICVDCGAVSEHFEARFAHDIAALSKRTGFTPDRSVIEIHGRCGACLADRKTA